VWCWDNLNIHLAPELADFAAQNTAWLRVYRLPAYAPDLNPAEGIWSLTSMPFQHHPRPIMPPVPPGTQVLSTADHAGNQGGVWVTVTSSKAMS
jgi:DDE superfamily endonuclease